MGLIPIYALADWAQAFVALMPRGRVWPKTRSSIQWHTAEALLGNHERQALAAAGEPADSFPGSCVTTLPSWESALGLPDPCAGPDATIAQRQAHVVARLTYRGGQSVPYFTAYAAQLGYNISIIEHAPARYGQKNYGKPRLGPAWAFAWTVLSPPVTVTAASYGRHRYREPYRTWAGGVLQCEIQRIAPAHTVVIFAYSGPTALGTWDAGSWDGATFAS